MTLRRFHGLAAVVSSRLRRGLSTAASRFQWAMIYHAPLVRSPARRASLQLLEPPCASQLLVPAHLVDPRPGPNPGSDATCQFSGGIVHAASGDGLLLLDFPDLPGMAAMAAKHGSHRAPHLIGAETGHEYPDIFRFVCNPLSGEMFRLPGTGGTKKIPAWYTHGLLTHSERGEGPPDRYAVAELCVDRSAVVPSLAVRRFLSQTGEWDKLVGSPSPLPFGRQMKLGHEVLAFAGRLWWVDVSWAALSVDPFADRPEFRFVELPSGSVMDPGEMLPELGRYRRMGCSEGRLRYAEVSREEPFVLSSFALEDDGSSWTLEHRMKLSRLWVNGVHPFEDRPQIGVVDPMKASVVHITIRNIVLAVDMGEERVLGYSMMGQGDGPERDPCYFKPCVLPPWLGSSRIPSPGTLSSGKADVKSKTLSVILVRVDRNKSN